MTVINFLFLGLSLLIKAKHPPYILIFLDSTHARGNSPSLPFKLFFPSCRMQMERISLAPKNMNE